MLLPLLQSALRSLDIFCKEAMESENFMASLIAMEILCVNN